MAAFFPTLLEPRRRVDVALHAVIMEAYVHGVSTRRRACRAPGTYDPMGTVAWVAVAGPEVILALGTGLGWWRECAEQQDRPNVLIALSDYQALNVMSVIPETLARLEENSVNYISTVSTTPLCAVGPELRRRSH